MVADVTPTARSLKYLRDLGFHAYVVERWIPQARVRKDVAGFMDILAWRADSRMVLAVQATTGENVSHRVEKIAHGLSKEDEIAFVDWKALENLVVVHGWAKQGARGKRKVWTLQEVWL